MANDLNHCSFIGRIGKQPETRYTGAGSAVTNFSIACGWKSKDKEGVEWINVVTFGKLAEICGEYLQKGSQVFVSGKMRTRKWQDNSGQDRYTTEIVADQMQMLGPKPEGQRKPVNQQQQAPQQATVPPVDFDDEIGF